MKPCIWLTLAAAVPLLCGGCAATTKSAEPVLAASEQKNSDSSRIVTKEYESVRVTGSLIPVRVPKSQNARALPGANPVTVISAEDFEKIVQRSLADRH